MVIALAIVCWMWARRRQRQEADFRPEIDGFHPPQVYNTATDPQVLEKEWVATPPVTHHAGTHNSLPALPSATSTAMAASDATQPRRDSHTYSDTASAPLPAATAQSSSPAPPPAVNRSQQESLAARRASTLAHLTRMNVPPDAIIHVLDSMREGDADPVAGPSTHPPRPSSTSTELPPVYDFKHP